MYQKEKTETKFQLQIEPQKAGETEDVWVDEDVVGELHSAATAAAAEETLGLGLGFWTVLGNGCGGAAVTTGA